MRFSERYGYKPVREVIQKESMDQELKNALWSQYDRVIFSNFKHLHYSGSEKILGSNLEGFFLNIYMNLFTNPLMKYLVLLIVAYLY